MEELERRLEIKRRRPKRRTPTRPTKASKERRLGEKQHRSTIKRLRGAADDE